jgi:hypothetical protein
LFDPEKAHPSVPTLRHDDRGAAADPVSKKYLLAKNTGPTF